MKLNKPLVRDILKNSLLSVNKGNRLSTEKIAEMGIPSYISGNKLSRWFAWGKIIKILEMCGEPSKARILDFGCGSGILFDSLHAYCEKLYASDVELIMAKKTAELLNINQATFLHPDELDTVIADETLDIVIAANVLEHIPSIDGNLRLFSRKLKKKGLLIVSSPTENMLYKTGRLALRLMGFHQFTGGYHRTDLNDIFDAILRFDFKRIETIQFPLSGLMALYWIGKFEKPYG